MEALKNALRVRWERDEDEKEVVLVIEGTGVQVYLRPHTDNLVRPQSDDVRVLEHNTSTNTLELCPLTRYRDQHAVYHWLKLLVDRYHDEPYVRESLVQGVHVATENEAEVPPRAGRVDSGRNVPWRDGRNFYDFVQPTGGGKKRPLFAWKSRRDHPGRYGPSRSTPEVPSPARSCWSGRPILG